MRVPKLRPRKPIKPLMTVGGLIAMLVSAAVVCALVAAAARLYLDSL